MECSRMIGHIGRIDVPKHKGQVICDVIAGAWGKKF